MAKLDKNQQQYALNRVEQLYIEAIKKLKSEDTKPNVDEMTQALIKKGFIVKDSYYLLRTVGLPETAEQKAAKDTRESKLGELSHIRDAAKDQIMLGDSQEVAKILVDLAAKFGV